MLPARAALWSRRPPATRPPVCPVSAARPPAPVRLQSVAVRPLPGRVGDSPIIGGGLYVDNEVGAAGATGIGENVMRYCATFLIVEFNSISTATPSLRLNHFFL